MAGCGSLKPGRSQIGSTWQVIHKHLGAGDGCPNQRLNGFPFSTCKTATDTRHVNGRLQFLRFDRQYSQALPERGVADWRLTVLGANTPLGNHVRNPNAWLNLDHGNSAKRERSQRFLLEVFRHGLGPSLGNGEDKTCAPRADVITDMGDDFVSVSDGGGRVTRDVLDLHKALFRQSALRDPAWRGNKGVHDIAGAETEW